MWTKKHIIELCFPLIYNNILKISILKVISNYKLIMEPKWIVCHISLSYKILMEYLSLWFEDLQLFEKQVRIAGHHKDRYLVQYCYTH